VKDIFNEWFGLLFKVISDFNFIAHQGNHLKRLFLICFFDSLPFFKALFFSIKLLETRFIAVEGGMELL
jgi:hypothetical protein